MKAMSRSPTTEGLHIPLRPLSRLKTALLIGVLCVGSATPGAKGAERPTTNDQSGGRLLTFAEGQALADIALEHSRATGRPDCSHLVHEILTDAGLSYPYATSSEIFAGIPQFQRMRAPQPGDLIVWPGHVGIVVSPEQTTFFSFTGSGPGTHQYSNDYWRHRGHPRFYRYVVAGKTQLTARALSEHDVKQSRDIEKTASSEQPQVEEHSSDAAIDAEPLPTDPSYNVEDHEFPEIEARRQSSIHISPEKVVEQLWDMAMIGELLTPHGRKKASRFFAQPTPLPDHNAIRVFSNSYGIAPAKIEGTTARLIVWCTDVGTIDAHLRFIPSPPPKSYKTARGYNLILAPVAEKTYGTAGKKRTSEKQGPAEWKIDAPQGDSFTTVNTAIRYVLEARNHTADRAVKKNANRTLASLLKYH
jgi:hypothetical protein